LAAKAIRQADVYVFAILAHEDNATVNPLDVAQWDFYILPTKDLNERTRSQHLITLKSLKAMGAGPVSYEGLAAAVRTAVPR